MEIDAVVRRYLQFLEGPPWGLKAATIPKYR
jgi:hypothetical protein